MVPPRKRQKVSSASQSTATSLSRNVSAASTHSTPPNTPPAHAQSPPASAGIFSPEHVKHLIANLDVELQQRTTRLRAHYNLLASTLQIRGEARMGRVPSHLRRIKIRELREMQKRGPLKEKQLYMEVMGTRLLASSHRPALKRKSSEDEGSDSEQAVDKRVFSGKSEPARSPLKASGNTLPRAKARTLQASTRGRNVTRGASVNKRNKK